MTHHVPPSSCTNLELVKKPVSSSPWGITINIEKKDSETATIHIHFWKCLAAYLQNQTKLFLLIKLWQELGFWTFLVFSKVVLSAPLSLYSELKWAFRDWKELSAQCQLSSLAAVCQLNILQIVSWAAKCQLIGRLSGRWSGCHPLI